MKKTVVAFVCAIIAAMLCACGAAKLAPADLKESDYNNVVTNDKVQLFVKQRTVTDETAEVTLDMENLTELDYTYDAVQRLEVYDGEKWRVVPDKQDAVTMQIYTLPANGTDEINFVIAERYDTLTEGRYRIVVPLVGADGEQVYAAAEFGIGRAEK